MTFKVRVPAAATPSLASAAVDIGSAALPGSDGRRLLPWLPQERTDWTTYAQWVVRPDDRRRGPGEAVPGAPAADAERRRRPGPASECGSSRQRSALRARRAQRRPAYPVTSICVMMTSIDVTR